MRRLVYALSLSTVTFVLSTWYFARELYLARARGEATTAPLASTEVRAGENAPMVSSNAAEGAGSAALEADARVESRSQVVPIPARCLRCSPIRSSARS